MLSVFYYIKIQYKAKPDPAFICFYKNETGV